MKAEADLITLFDEKIDESKPISIFHPIYTWKTTTYEDYILRPMLKQIFKSGELVYELPDIEEIREYCKSEVESLWDEFKRFDNKVDLSKNLWELKNNLLTETVKISKKKQSDLFTLFFYNLFNSFLNNILSMIYEIIPVSIINPKLAKTIGINFWFIFTIFTVKNISIPYNP